MQVKNEDLEKCIDHLKKNDEGHRLETVENRLMFSGGYLNKYTDIVRLLYAILDPKIDM